MNMIEKIELLMRERDLKKSDVSRDSGIPYTTLDGLFKKGFKGTRSPTVKKLALFFDVSMEYLVNDNEDDRDFGKIIISDFSSGEQHLIMLWRQLPSDEQMKMLGRIESKLEEGGE